MNPWDLSASELLVWGIVLHLIADWPLQNDWMATNKQNLNHPAGWLHAWIHGALFVIIFAWVAIPLALAHLLIDTRRPVIWWSRLIRQTQPSERSLIFPDNGRDRRNRTNATYFPLWDAGIEVRLWTDQVFHIICIAVAALLIA